MELETENSLQSNHLNLTVFLSHIVVHTIADHLSGG
jgi:hypothetical protein